MTPKNPKSTDKPIEPEMTKTTAKKPLTEKPSSETQVRESLEELSKETKCSAKKCKNGKIKVIRDTFSFPEQDYLKISGLKKICLSEGIHVKKSEILRAGLHLLTKLNMEDLKQAVEQVEKLKTGRPNSDNR